MAHTEEAMFKEQLLSMSEETTGATTESTTAAESAMPTPDATVQSAITDPSATSSPAENAAASALPAAPATADTATGADTPDVDPMDLAMQQMPPLNEIEVPGSESGGNNGGRGGGRGGRNARYSQDSSEPRAGQVVTGTVVHIDNDGVLVDVGMKSEGLIRPNELSREPVQNVEDLVKVGDKIDVFVMEPERDGTLLLSKKRADFEKAWDKVQEALADGRTIQAMVNDRKTPIQKQLGRNIRRIRK
jgi:4-hydroxy-3-methylbut-2-enyl diphosphate reductase